MRPWEKIFHAFTHSRIHSFTLHESRHVLSRSRWFKSTYAADQVVFPIRQDRYFVWAVLLFAFAGVPLLANAYWLSAILIPFLILSLAALGLNLLVGYCGQISLGTGGFMAVGAYAAYNLTLRIPGLESGHCIPVGRRHCHDRRYSVRHSQPAHQGILSGGGDSRGAVLPRLGVQPHTVVHELHAVGFANSPADHIVRFHLRYAGAQYLLCLAFAVAFAVLARNLVRGRIGRAWMAIRDMDVAAEIIGIRPLYAKLSAFAVSSFFIGVAGALWAFVHLGSWEPLAFDVNRSFSLLFMVIIGGLASIPAVFWVLRSFTLLPLLLNQFPAWLGLHWSTALISHLESMIFGALIVFFLIVEPLGLARLWRIAKEKLRLWPFPH